MSEISEMARILETCERGGVILEQIKEVLERMAEDDRRNFEKSKQL